MVKNEIFTVHLKLGVTFFFRAGSKKSQLQLQLQLHLDKIYQVKIQLQLLIYFSHVIAITITFQVHFNYLSSELQLQSNLLLICVFFK